MATPPSTPTYNILLLGETQSGKSTLMEALQKYADPEYTITRDRIGDRCFSKTSDIITATIHTDLPSYFTTIIDQGVRVDYGQLLDVSQEDYEDELDQKVYRLQREQSSHPKFTFNLIDTPGLNDSSLFDEVNIALIFKALENIKSIHLVVITVANNPFTEGLRGALQSYVNLLPELNGNIVFLHTRIDYAKMHPDDEEFSGYMAEKQRILHDLMGRDTVPHILIDNDLESQKTIRICITQNMLRDLLGMATFNQSVPIEAMVMNKTEKMQIVDSILRHKYHEIIIARETTLGGKNREEQAVLARIGDLKARIAEHEQTLQDIKRDLAFYDKDSLVLHHEESYQQGVSLMGLVEPAKAMYFPGKTRAEKQGFIHHSIDHIDILERNVKILQQAGGLGQAFWAVRFRNRKQQNGLYRVKIYITKRKKFSEKIEELRTVEIMHRELLANCNAELAEDQLTENEQPLQLDIIMGQLKLDRYLLGRVSTSTLDKRVFQEMVEAKVYVRDIVQSAINVEKFYFDNMKWMEELERTFDGSHFPVNTSSVTIDEGTDIAQASDTRDATDFESLVVSINKAVRDLSVTDTELGLET
ncbi:hypothetical protein BGZ82_009896 [Podila clonocystis]|nr:hypothetical protein BGZ82_009896 [Podila clonocystis]